MGRSFRNIICADFNLSITSSRTVDHGKQSRCSGDKGLILGLKKAGKPLLWVMWHSSLIQIKKKKKHVSYSRARAVFPVLPQPVDNKAGRISLSIRETTAIQIFYTFLSKKLWYARYNCGFNYYDLT